MIQRSGAVVALFAKAPRPGGVKTRLAGALGAEGAAEFHRLCVQAVWRRLVAGPFETLLYCDQPCAELESLAGPDRFRLQQGEDLGERMRRCFDQLLAGGSRQGLIVGSDAPTLSIAQITQAVEALAHVDVVLGPAADGGFALIGARRTAPHMFQGVTWSSEATLVETLAAVRAARLSARETDARFYDVDRPADLERLRRDPAAPTALRDWIEDRLGPPLQERF